MFNPLSSLLNIKVFGIALAAMALAFGATWLTQRAEIRVLSDLLDEKTARIESYVVNEATLRGSIDDQNQAVNAMRAISERNQDRATRALGDAQEANRNLQAQVADILATPIPAPFLEACEAGDALILEVYQ